MNTMLGSKVARTTAAKSATQLWSVACVGLAAVYACALVLEFAPRARAQSMQAGPNLNVAGNEMQTREELSNMDALGDKDQVADFQAFSKERDPAKKIQRGDRFLVKYPKSPLIERVDVGMMNAYDQQQDWKNTYRLADNALALKPDDVDVLTTVGWTIPHVYSPSDPDADQELDKAESYSKRALDVLAKLPKPPNMNNEQFAASKTKRTLEAHSALGLVYFRRGDYGSSAAELAISTKDNSTPDQTDLFVLGVDLQSLNHDAEAADAFQKCAAIAGPLQGQCKDNIATKPAAK
jgi:tetratricopeptide (TPR) repeat protein